MTSAPLGPRRSLWVLPGGIVGGVWVGVVFALGATMPGAVTEPSGFAGVVSGGIPIVGATYGAFIGAVFGFPAGVLAFGLLVIGWAVRLPRGVQGVTAAGFVTAGAAAAFLAVIGPGVPTVALIALSAVAAAGGTVLLFAIDSSLGRRAQDQRPIR